MKKFVFQYNFINNFLINFICILGNKHSKSYHTNCDQFIDLYNKRMCWKISQDQLWNCNLLYYCHTFLCNLQTYILSCKTSYPNTNGRKKYFFGKRFAMIWLKHHLLSSIFCNKWCLHITNISRVAKIYLTMCINDN